MWKLILYRDSLGKCRWRLKASNGRVVADSAESYQRPSGAAAAARALMRKLSGVVLKDETGQPARKLRTAKLPTAKVAATK